jgi:hypothetical protein
MITFGNSIFKLFSDLRFGLELARHELSHTVDHFKRNVQRVNRVGPIEQVQSVLLLNSAQDKLFFVSVTEEKLFAQKRKEYLAAFVHVVKDATDETTRCHSVVYLQDLS